MNRSGAESIVTRQLQVLVVSPLTPTRKQQHAIRNRKPEPETLTPEPNTYTLNSTP